jgi:hypothetical protein
MGKICSVYVLFGISPRIWNGLRTYTEVPLYVGASIVISMKHSLWNEIPIYHDPTLRKTPVVWSYDTTGIDRHVYFEII